MVGDEMRKGVRVLARVFVRLAAMLALGLVTAACGSDGDEPAAGSDPVRVEVAIEGGEVDPAGERVEVAVGQPVELVVSSDAHDELHVHSDPEHEFAVEPGEEQVFRFRIDRAGVYEVESHELGVTIVQLEVR